VLGTGGGSGGWLIGSKSLPLRRRMAFGLLSGGGSIAVRRGECVG
jgi:hypothetical protein